MAGSEHNVWHGHYRSNDVDRMFDWKRMAKRSAIVTALVGVACITTSTIVLFLRTGRYLQQPYDWYALKPTGERLFGDHLELPTHLPSTCNFHDARDRDTAWTTLDEVVARFQGADTTPPQEKTHVYVVPFFWDRVIELNLDQVRPMGENSYSDLSSIRSRSGVHNSSAIYEKIRPVDEITLFPYLWHNILGSYFDDRVTVTFGSPWSRSVEALNLEFEIVRTSEQLTALPKGSNLLVVTQSINIIRTLFGLEPAILPPEAKVGFLSLSREDCNNNEPETLLENHQLKFGFFPYGDCSLVDGDRFSVVPLGPSYEHGFPINAHMVDGPTVAEKKYLLNLMVSWTVGKPTRIQAAMVALEVCSAKERYSNVELCIVGHNDMMFKALQFVDDHVGSNLRWFLSSAPDAYITNLKQSVFTLCPLGKNPEQYRIWEALAAGSIPIIEEIPGQSLPGSFFHPSYPMSWRCMPEDIHGILKRHNAPVLFVSDWQRDLPPIIDRYFAPRADNPSLVEPTEELVALQASIQPWFRSLGGHLQANLIAKTMEHFGPAS